MHLNGFEVEILVDETPLQEFKVPILETTTTTGPSYIIEELDGNKYESGLVTYAAVSQSGARFSVRFSVNKASADNVFIAELYVDGKHDHRCKKICSPEYKIKDYFWNASRNNKCYFKFTNLIDSTMDSNNQIQQIVPTKGGFGAVSVYFYKGKNVEEKMINPPEFTLDHNTMTEEKKHAKMMYETAFDIDEGRTFRISKVQKSDPLPVAVLHLHYRPAALLACKGFDLSSTFYKDNEEDIKIVDTSIKEEKIIMVISDDERNVSHVKKRRIREIIEILDSDGEKDTLKIKKSKFYATKFNSSI